MNYLDEAKKAVEVMHGCSAKHVETVPVREVFRGQVAWEGDVEVFTLTNHPKAKRAFAWGYAKGQDAAKREFVTVLEVPPVTSPQTAVKVAIAAHARALKG